jgi:hypothetical protein
VRTKILNCRDRGEVNAEGAEGGGTPCVVHDPRKLVSAQLGWIGRGEDHFRWFSGLEAQVLAGRAPVAKFGGVVDMDLELNRAGEQNVGTGR